MINLQPGGHLFSVEPHHNLPRAARLFHQYMSDFRAREFYMNGLNWATHDFVTCDEIFSLCSQGEFEDVRVSGHWFPYLRRLVPDSGSRFMLKQLLGTIPGWRHLAAVLAVEARRSREVVP